jgi:hypothetical protein
MTLSKVAAVTNDTALFEPVMIELQPNDTVTVPSAVCGKKMLMA